MLTKNIANAIVKETTLRLHRNINIMDMNGIIIATLNKSRLNTVHEGALEVLKSGKALNIYPYQDYTWKGAEPGVNLPIRFQDNIIGVIGITGNPDEMGDIGELVKMATELMISQEFIASQLEWKQRTKEMVIEQLLRKEFSHNTIERGISMLNFELVPPFMTILIQVDELTIQKQDFINRVENSFDSHHVMAGFISLNQLLIFITGYEDHEALQKIELLRSILKDLLVKFRIAYSLAFHELGQFNQAYSDCKLALEIADPSLEIISFTQIEVKALLYRLDKTVGDRFSNRVLKSIDETMAMTLKSFFENNLNIQKTADSLFLHRNSLIYRLDKITIETGYNPRLFYDALILQVALWIEEQYE